MLLATLATAVVILILLAFFRKRKLLNGLPPGPRGIPILGNLVQMGKTPHLQFSQWAEEFGKLYTIQLANKPALVINDQKLIKELFGMMAATGKFHSELIMMITQGSFGIAGAAGQEWLEQKQFLLRALKQFGFGQGYRMEPLILRECDDLCNWIETEKGGGKVYFSEKLKQVTANIAWNMISGERMNSHESPIVHYLDQLIYYLQQATQTGLIFFSWIRYIAPVRSGYVGFKQNIESMHKYVETAFQEHKLTRIKNEPVRNLIDAYIEKMDSCRDPQSSFYGALGWKHSFNSVIGFLVAGGETAGSMINWAIFYLIAFPQVQKKLMEEIDMIIEQNQSPCLADKEKMPYTEAVILESLRLASMIPFGVVHELIEDVEFHGYRLPKGLVLFPNLYHVQHDKNIWGDPEVFRPERFLESGGDKLKEFIVIFEPGKRSCPGETLAKDMMFLFLTKLLQKYTFSKDPSIENEIEYVKPDVGAGLVSRKLPVVVKNRI